MGTHNSWFGPGALDDGKGVIATLLKRYPRKATPFLEQAFHWRLLLTGIQYRVRRAAALFPPPRNVLIIGIEVPSRPEFMAQVRAELPLSRHNVTFSTKTMEPGRGKFENLNDLLLKHSIADIDWLIVTDDDVAISPHFLDCFIFLLEKFDFKIGQPAHKLRSYYTFDITRRHWGTIARQTNYVEIGPIFAIHRTIFQELVPFPNIGMGWGLDYHWGYLAKKNNWRIGIIDAFPIQHLRPVASGYGHGPAQLQALEFLNDRGGLTAREAHRTLAALRALPGGP